MAERSRAEFEDKRGLVGRAVLESRYANLVGLLGSSLSTERYLQIVRNRILVDVQGRDVLYQIFTCSVLQRRPGEEAPFLEFIQRVCHGCDKDDGACPTEPVKAGCGGFGIRNFLTLFLSIEISTAITQITASSERGDSRGERHARDKVGLLTRQMNQSNPILNEISDAMDREGRATDGLLTLSLHNDQQRRLLEREAESARERKRDATGRLQSLSDDFARQMQELEAGFSGAPSSAVG